MMGDESDTMTMKVFLMFERWHRNFLISEIGKVYGGWFGEEAKKACRTRTQTHMEHMSTM